jgi:hypothetical protein
MGKLTWQQLGMIFEGSFDVTPNEASEIISDYLFSKNWVGDKNKTGRMWQDQFTCAAFVWYLKEVEKYRKKNRIAFTTAVKRMCSEDHPEHMFFIQTARLGKLKPKRFNDLVGIWKLLPFVKQKKKTYSKGYAAQLKVVAKKHKKYQNEAQELELLRKRSAQILADRRK